MKNKLLLLIACCAIVVSCSKDENGGGGKDKTYAEVKTLDIANAEYLYSTQTANSARSRAGSADPAQLFKVLSNGTTEGVAIVDANGETIPTDEIYVNPATNDLIFFAYTYKTFDYNDGHGYDWYNYFGPAYFVRKSDGAVFEVPEMFYYNFGWNGTNGSFQHANEIYKDKNQNLYCAASSDNFQTRSIYKIESNSGITATKLVDNFGTNYDYDFCVDNLGNILYVNTLGDTWCRTVSGEKFLVEDDIFFPNLTIFPNNQNGGFFCYDGLDLYEYKVNAENRRIDAVIVSGLTREEMSVPIPLSDKVVIVGVEARTITVMKSLTDIRKIDMSGGLGNIFEITKGKNLTDNYLYWYDDAAIYSLNLNTGEKEAIHQLNTSRRNNDFLFADDMIIFYSVDRQTEKTYMCEIKSGVYSETEIGTTGADSTPSVISFMKVR